MFYLNLEIESSMENLLNLMAIQKWIPVLFLKQQDYSFHVFSSVQLLSCVQLFAAPWTAACQASLSITNSRSPPKPMSIELVMPSNHLMLCHPLLPLPSIFPSIRSFQMSQLFASGGQSIGVSASTSVLPVNTQDWSPLEWTGSLVNGRPEAECCRDLFFSVFPLLSSSLSSLPEHLFQVESPAD